MHRRFLDVLRAELARMEVKDLNAVQALLLSNIGEEEIVIRDLVERGYYQGSNVSYNIKKLTESGYLDQARSEHDKRSVRVKLTEKALGVVARIRELEEKNAAAFATTGISEADVESAAESLRKIERVWSDYIHYGGE
ncbi:MAG: winged helix DNA-binding protein [Rhodospirillaceae bacterium]|nr:winged helix DNA-binding protein [Rhodospirillaceae bacterium]